MRRGAAADPDMLERIEELALCRFVQEALNDASKYAKATRISVNMKAALAWVRVGVADDGIGFDTTQLKSATRGIAGMRFRIERLGGSSAVNSALGAGTRLTAMIPGKQRVA